MTEAPDAAPPAGWEPGRRRRVPTWFTAFVLVSVVAVVSAVMSVRLPYYSEGPGDVFDASPLVTIEDGPSFEPEGSISFPTVSISRGRLTPYDLFLGWLDGDIDILEESKILPPDMSPEEYRKLNFSLMDDSKRLAAAVALEHLGYDDVIVRSGAQIRRIAPATPAADSLVAGETLVAVDDNPVTTAGDAVRLLGGHRPGDAVRLRVAPVSGPEREIEIVLVAHPSDAGRALLGVELETRVEFGPFPFEIDLRTDNISGPSAGLAFTLHVLDRLTDGELTGGLQVAATGEIAEDGSVRGVGGLKYKAAAVRKAGIDLFLVPTSDVAQARQGAGDLRVVGVDTLDAALRVLASAGGNGMALGQPGKVA